MNEALRRLPEEAYEWLLDWLDEIRLACNIPSERKTARVVPVNKLGKSSCNLTSYRPISLLSCMAKLFKVFTHYRLTWILEANYLLPLEQADLCAHLAAQDSFLNLRSSLEHNRAIGNYTLVGFLSVRVHSAASELVRQ